MKRTDPPDISPDEIRAQVQRILNCTEFARSQQMRDFLQFVVEETLEGREDRLKQFTIATNVFGRSNDFEPQNDPVVRVLAGKIRRDLHRYYLEEGATDPIRLDLPKGGYVPSFEVSEEHEAAAFLGAPKNRVVAPVIAVLPFFDHSTNTSKPFLAESIAGEIATELSRFKYFRVVAYYSSRQFKDSGRSAGEAGQELGCDYLLTGSLNLGDTELRLNTQLITVENEHQVWSRRWELAYSPDKLFSLINQLVSQVVGRVADNQGVVLRYASKAAAARQSEEPSLFETILRFHGYASSITPETHEVVMAELKRAVEASPKYGMAWACLGLMYLDTILFDFSIEEDALEKARTCAKRAVSLDPTCQQAYFTMATQCLIDGDKQGVAVAAKKMYELNPGAAYMAGSAGWFLTLIGEEQMGLDMMAQALELNPHQPPWFHFAPLLAALRCRDYQEALNYAEQFEMQGFHWSSLCQASTAGLAGDKIKADNALKMLLELKPDIGSKVERLVGYYVVDQDLRDLFVAGLQKAGLEISQEA